ncbi:MAG TPA: gluconate 2-dehydrogenase subunit 3 family protein [Chryseolinea sp.]|nr:gluconate 2-dehydrogenase subunit 3 family protein [Chryseolinea sp.]
MNRRTSLKKLLVASGGLIALPSWAQRWSLNDLTTHRSTFSLSNQETLASVTDTIIPAGNSIGALSVGVDKFLQKLFDNCYEKEVQENIKTRLTALEASAKSAYGNSFASSDQIQRQTLLENLSVSENKDEKEFFALIKSETIRGFSTSREIMLQFLNYKILPGHYYGCVDVNA